MEDKKSSSTSWINAAVIIAIGAWAFGSCQRNSALKSCGRNDGEYIYSWKGTNKVACIIKRGRENNLEIVTPNGSGKGAFRGDYVIGKAGGSDITCVGRNITGLPYGICTD